MKILTTFCLALAVLARCQQVNDVYHQLHLPRVPPPHPTYARAPLTHFSCDGRPKGYYADTETGCQAFHLCWRQRLVSTGLCSNSTLFNEQFQICDYYYNVRCGSPYEDL